MRINYTATNPLKRNQIEFSGRIKKEESLRREERTRWIPYALTWVGGTLARSNLQRRWWKEHRPDPRHAYDNVERPRCPQCAAESGRPASGVRRRDSIGERREAGFVMGGGRMRRRELDYRTTCSVSFYFMGPSPPYLLGGARKSAKNILGWRERSWSTDQKIGRVNLWG